MRFLSGGAVLCLMLASVALSACGQRGPLLLPSEASKKNDRASYMLYSPKKADLPAVAPAKDGQSTAEQVAPAADSK